MASGDSLVICKPLARCGPSTVFASPDTILGTSTPAELIPVLDFDDTLVENVDFHCFMPRNYAGGGVTLTFVWSAAAATNNGVWAAGFRRINDDAEDLDTTAHTYDFNTTADLTPPSVVGEVAYDTLTFTDGADMDSVVAGEEFILRVRRPAPIGTKITGDESLHTVEIKET